MDPRRAGPEQSQIARMLGRVRARARSVLLARSAGWLVGGFGLALTAWSVADFEFRFSPWLRWSVWIGGVLLLVVWARRSALPAIRFAPSLTDVALRVEARADGSEGGIDRHAAGGARVRGQIASGLELSAPDARRSALEQGLADQSARRAAERIAELDRSRTRLVRWRAVRVAGPLALVAIVLGLGFAIARPSLAATGVARALAPWSGAAWPKRTLLADRTELRIRETGVEIVLDAELVRTHRAPGRTPVYAYVRMGADESSLGEPRRVAMVSQAEPASDGSTGERLSARLAVPRVAGEPERLIEYWFETEDDRTGAARVLAVDPPVVRSASVTIRPPAYAGGPVLERSLEPGVDDGARLGPVLAGSELTLDVAFSKPAAALPVIEDDAGADGATLAAALGAVLDGRGEVEIAEGAERLRVRGTLAEPLDLMLRLRDEHGIATPPDRLATYRVGVQRDALPTVAISEPAQDEAMLATAVVPVEARGEDDVALRWLRIEALPAAAPASAGAPPEPTGEVRVIARTDAPAPAMDPNANDSRENGARASALKTGASLDLATLGVRPGDEVVLQGVTRDTFELFGVSHEEVRSEPRRLRIISEQQLAEALREQLGIVRDEARRLDERQRELSRRRDRSEVQGEGQSGSQGDTADPASAARRQGNLSEQVASTRTAVERVQERIDRNRLDDTALSSLTEGAGEALERAAEASDRAEAALERAGEAGDGSDARDAAEREAREAQAEVRESLARVAELLDRGEDAWVVQRAIDQLIEQQERLQEDTQRFGEQTRDGASPAELSPSERSELQRIADRQREAMRDAERTLDELNERSRQLEEANPTQAEAMERAAETGRQEGLSRQLEQAAEQLEQNQTGQARSAQQQALETLEQMKEEIENADRRRDEVLQRVLAQVVERLDALIETQRAEIAALQRTRDAGEDFAPRGEAMRGLHVATLGLVDRIEVSFAELVTVATLVDEAAAAQQEAILSLRQSPANHASALVEENLSLTRLLDAREEAKRLEQEAAERDQERQRQELRAKYADILQRQVALQGETRAFEGKRLSRRDKYSVRALGERQRTIAGAVATLEAETESFADAALFVFAHARLDAAMEDSATALVESTDVAQSIAAQQGAVRVLRSILEALDDASSDPSDFNSGQSGGGGEQGGGSGQEEPLIPPVAELKLLRSMQIEALELTRRIDTAEGTPVSEEALAELQRDLAELGRELIERMAEQGPPGAPGAGGGSGGAGGTGEPEREGPGS